MTLTTPVVADTANDPDQRTILSDALGTVSQTGTRVEADFFPIPSLTDNILRVLSGEEKLAEPLTSDSRGKLIDHIREILEEDWQADEKVTGLARREAILEQLAGAINPDRVLPDALISPVVKLITDSNIDRIKVLGLCCLRYNERGLNVATSIMRDPEASEEVRVAAIKTLRTINSDRSFDAINELIEKPEEFKVTSSTMSGLLGALVGSSHPAAFNALKKHFTENLDSLLPQDRETLVLALCVHPNGKTLCKDVIRNPSNYNVGEETRLYLIRQTQDPNESFVRTLVEIGLDNQYESRAVRLAAWEAIKRSDKGAITDLDGISETLSDLSEDREIVAAMIEATGDLDAGCLVEEVCKHLSSDNADVDELVTSAILDRYTDHKNAEVVSAIARFIDNSVNPPLTVAGLAAISGIDTTDTRRAIDNAMRSEDLRVARQAYLSYGGFKDDSMSSELLMQHVLDSKGISSEKRLFALEALIQQGTERSTQALIGLAGRLQKGLQKNKSVYLSDNTSCYEPTDIRTANHFGETDYLLLSICLDNLPQLRWDQYRRVTYILGAGDQAEKHKLSYEEGNGLINTLIDIAEASSVPNASTAITRIPVMQDRPGSEGPVAICLEGTHAERLMSLVDGAPKQTGRWKFKKDVPGTWIPNNDGVSNDVVIRVIERLAALEVTNNGNVKNMLVRMAESGPDDYKRIIHSNLADEMREDGGFACLAA